MGVGEGGKTPWQVREDAHKKSFFLVVGQPREGGGEPPEPLKKTLFYQLKKMTPHAPLSSRGGGPHLSGQTTKKLFFMCVFPKGRGGGD